MKDIWNDVFKPIWVDVACLWAGVTAYYMLDFKVWVIASVITLYMIVREVRREDEDDEEDQGD